MRTYLHDGSFESFLTALALALEGGADCAVARADGDAEAKPMEAASFRKIIK